MEILSAAGAGGQTWAVRVDRLDTEEIVFSARADESRQPASTVKLFTTAAALHRLGPDFAVTTSVYAAGAVTDGILDGDLVLYGRGDPNLSGRFHGDEPTAVLTDMAQQVRAAGIREIAGAVIGDGTYFEDRDFGPWRMEDQHRWYAARVSALSFNDNCVDVYVGPGRAGGRQPAYRWEPVTPYVQMRFAARTVPGQRARVYAWRGPGMAVISIGGTIGGGARIQPLPVTVEDPALFAASVLHDELWRAGVTVRGRPRPRRRKAAGASASYPNEVVRRVSEPLADVLGVINGRSQNLHAELLCKTLGKQMQGDGSWEAGLRVIDSALCALGVNTVGVRQVDGSGLGRANRATATSLVEVLTAMAHHPHAGVFEDSLVHVGVDANMTDLAKSVPFGVVRAKSGSLKGVLGLAGYIRAPGRAPLAFALLGSGPRTGSAKALKATRDQLVYALARHAPRLP